MHITNENVIILLGLHCNLGGGMDAKSGVFTAPVAGSYLFTIHACTHDMHKALLSIRHNGNQVIHKINRKEVNHRRIACFMLQNKTRSFHSMLLVI